MHPVTALLTTAILCLGLSTSALGEHETRPQPLVKIDDFTVTSLHFALFASQTGRNPQDPQGQISLLNELVNNFMVAHSDQGRALENNPEVAAALEVARARLIAQAFVQRQIDSQPVDEARLHQLYEADYAQPGREYKARHILLQSEDEAKQIIAQLDAGADFATLASEHSTGPSKSAGGDLGWFESEQMVAEFSAATQQLSDGSYSKSPVKTRFGWHVILREQSRELPAPEFDTLKPELERQIQRQQVAEAVAKIRENTRIQVQEPEIEQ